MISRLGNSASNNFDGRRRPQQGWNVLRRWRYATAAGLSAPLGLTCDGAGLWFADAGNHVIRLVPAGLDRIVTALGSSYFPCGGPFGIAKGSSGDSFVAAPPYLWDFPNGVPPPIPIGSPSTPALSVANGPSGYSYCIDALNEVDKRIRTSTGSTTAIVAGNKLKGYSGDGGQATAASLYVSTSVAVAHGLVLPSATVDSFGNIYIADMGNNVIRKVDTSGNISTVAGTNNLPAGYSGDGGPAVWPNFHIRPLS